MTKIREFLINRLSYSSAEVAEIITSKTIIIDYPTEEIDNNISFLKSFLKVDETEVKRLIFENPFLLIAKQNKYKDVHRYMKLFLDIKDDDFITIAKKLPLILRTDVN